MQAPEGGGGGGQRWWIKTATHPWLPSGTFGKIARIVVVDRKTSSPGSWQPPELPQRRQR